MYKIVIAIYSEAAPLYIRQGWANAFRKMGHQVYLWQPSACNAFQIFEEVDPDLFIGETYRVDRALFKCLQKSQKCKCLLFGSSWGPLTDSIDRKAYPIDIAHETEINTMKDLMNACNKPQCIFIHHAASLIDETMGHWGTITKYASILNAADTSVYYKENNKPLISADVGYCGNLWGYKSRSINNLIMPLSNYNLKLKIFGTQKWPIPQYLGSISSDMERHLYNFSKISVNCSEPHSIDYGFDLVERIFKIGACNGLLVTDRVSGLKEYFGDNILYADTHKDIINYLEYLKSDPHTYDDIKNAFHKEILQNHTYLNRAQQMLELAGLP